MNTRLKWLQKKKLTVREFTDAVGLDYNTGFRYFQGETRMPRRLYGLAILNVYPDFPIK